MTNTDNDSRSVGQFVGMLLFVLALLAVGGWDYLKPVVDWLRSPPWWEGYWIEPRRDPNDFDGADFILTVFLVIGLALTPFLIASCFKGRSR